MRTQAEIDKSFSESVSLPETGRIHFIGIGGAGMSAIARILLHRGREVSGTDLVPSGVLDELRVRGADISIGHDAQKVFGASAVVVTDAVDLKSNPEVSVAKELGLPLLRRSQALADLLKNYRVIAVTGTHGKSTVTAMIGHILESHSFDPMVVIGADSVAYGSNVRIGNGEYAVVEACEAYNSFLDLTPEIVVLTNLEPEHLDFHKNWENLLSSVEEFVKKARGTPKFIYCACDEGASKVAHRVQGGVPYDFSLKPWDAVYDKGTLRTSFGDFRLQQFGRHNALNALAAVTAAECLSIPSESALQSLLSYRGLKRRMEKIGERDGVIVYDDYAHHPTEIRATLDAFREFYPEKRLVVAFQPHLYSRTRDFLDGFIEALCKADVVFLTDIYPAREEPIPGISSTLICEGLEKSKKECFHEASKHFLPRTVANYVRTGDVVIGMGAGDIEAFAPNLLKEIARKSEPLRVGVFCGGQSTEREVSKSGGINVANALKRKGYRVELYDPSELLIGQGNVQSLTGVERPDIVFLLLHGTSAEDGTIQGFLELLRIPYTGSGVLPSATAIDKYRTKQILSAHGIPTPRAKLLSLASHAVHPPFTDMGGWEAFPIVVKPNRQGSTIGLGIARERKELEKCIEVASKYDSQVLLEEYIEGVEITAPVLDDEPLPIVEIRPKSGSYDFMAKYTPNATEEIVPANISKKAEENAKRYALDAHRILGLADFSRSDMIVRGDEVFFLEVNTIPGMTPTSLLPRSASAAGIAFDELCCRILESALKRYGIEKKKT
ncbi:MAG TPA: UDP-N-acetylmuramate--L-alanine ligase [Fimbriimonadales bacterium]|nr:UDP-N-acetylmuramate--L-alanine ligase [Fimbriimonadales bacterium]